MKEKRETKEPILQILKRISRSVSDLFSQLKMNLIPVRYNKDLLIGEMVKAHRHRLQHCDFVYTASVGELYAATKLFMPLKTRLAFVSAFPRMRELIYGTQFLQLNSSEIDKTLLLAEHAVEYEPKLLSVNGLNSTETKWWADWFDVPRHKITSCDVAWAADHLENTNAKTGLAIQKTGNGPALFIVECSNLTTQEHFDNLISLSRCHESNIILGIVESQEQQRTLDELARSMKNVSVIMERRSAYSRGQRYWMLARGLLFAEFNGPKSRLRHTPASPPLPSVGVAPKVSKFKSIIHQRSERFAANANLLLNQKRMDVCLSFDVVSAPTGHALALANSARHIIDFNETADMSNRIAFAFKQMNHLQMTSYMKFLKTSVSTSKKSISSSIEMARTAHRVFGLEVVPVGGFHERYTIERNAKLRAELGLKKSDFLLMHCCTYAKDYGSHLLPEILVRLEKNVHLALVGRAASPAFQEELEIRFAKCGVSDRVHFLGTFNSVKEYLGVLSCGDAGLIVLDNSIQTVFEGLSNRFIDLLAAQVPLVSIHTLEASEIIKKFGLGVIVPQHGVENYVNGIGEIMSLIEDGHDLRASAQHAQESLNFNTEVRKFTDLAGSPKPGARNAVVVFQRGLVHNRRVIRLSNALVKAGWKVTLLVGRDPPEQVKSLMPDVAVVEIPGDRHWFPGEVDFLTNQWDEND